MSRGPSGFTRRRKPFAKLPVSTISPGHGRGDADAGLAGLQAEGGAVLGEAFADGGEDEGVGRPDEARRQVVEAEGDGAVLLRPQPGVAAVVEAVGQDEEAAGVGSRAAAFAVGHEAGVRLAPPAVEGALAAPPGHLAGQRVAAVARRGAGSSSNSLVPEDRGGLAAGDGAPGRDDGDGERPDDGHEDEREDAEEDEVGRVEDEVGVAREHLETSVSPSSRALALRGRG